jgi:hypothetical protein
MVLGLAPLQPELQMSFAHVRGRGLLSDASIEAVL